MPTPTIATLEEVSCSNRGLPRWDTSREKADDGGPLRFRPMNNEDEDDEGEEDDEDDSDELLLLLGLALALESSAC